MNHQEFWDRHQTRIVALYCLKKACTVDSYAEWQIGTNPYQDKQREHLSTDICLRYAGISGGEQITMVKVETTKRSHKIKSQKRFYSIPVTAMEFNSYMILDSENKVIDIVDI